MKQSKVKLLFSRSDRSAWRRTSSSSDFRSWTAAGSEATAAKRQKLSIAEI
jgi:hypothetical protein